jgi:plastocyanin
MKNILAIFAVAVSALPASVAANAAEHEVKMLNKGAEGIMAFEPNVVKVAPGEFTSSPPTRATTWNRLTT